MLVFRLSIHWLESREIDFHPSHIERNMLDDALQFEGHGRDTCHVCHGFTPIR
jgi:hypothetical protein